MTKTRTQAQAQSLTPAPPPAPTRPEKTLREIRDLIAKTLDRPWVSFLSLREAIDLLIADRRDKRREWEWERQELMERITALEDRIEEMRVIEQTERGPTPLTVLVRIEDLIG